MNVVLGDTVIYQNECHEVIWVSDDDRLVDLRCLRTGEIVWRVHTTNLKV